jgi:putative hydrolase of the HAD superfamily
VKIEALLFDLGKVLVDFNFNTGIEALHSCCSISRDRFEHILTDEIWISRYERGEVSTEGFLDYLRQTAGLDTDLESFCRMWSSVFLPEPIVSEELLIALKRNYPLILVSNTNEAHIDFIRSKYTVLDHFDHHVLSYKIGALKPDKRIYEQAIRAAGCPPESLFFTDDREENVAAAEALGIRAHRFESEARLIQALQDAGIEVGDIVHRDPITG